MFRTILAALTMGLLGLAFAAAPAHADRSCTGSIGAEAVSEDVVVPDGESCTLRGTEVEGNVLVGSDAALLARGVSVTGNVQAGGHRRVTVEPRSGEPSRVDGNIELADGGIGYVRAAAIGGNLQVARNAGLQGAISNEIDGDLQAFDNEGRYLIFDNRIGGNLQCAINEPEPYGGQNTVGGDAKWQCADLGSDSGGDPDDVIAPRISLAGPVIGFAKDTTYLLTRCNEACDLRAAGLIVVRGPDGVSRIRTGVADTELDGGQRQVLRLSIPREDSQFIEDSARRPDLTVRMWVRVRATDASGNTDAKWRIKRIER